jgi:hypothetical protein
MIELPKEITKSTRINPKTMVLFSQPKTGKTTIVAALKDCLTIDLEEGSDFVDALKFDVVKEAKKAEKLPIVVLKELINAIKEANNEKGDYVYKFIAIDTVTALEDIVLPLANKMYKDTPKPKIGLYIRNYIKKLFELLGNLNYFLYICIYER